MAKIPKTTPEEWERMRRNRERLQRLLERRLAEEEKARAAKATDDAKKS